jgi:hypothetical protein
MTEDIQPILIKCVADNVGIYMDFRHSDAPFALSGCQIVMIDSISMLTYNRSTFDLKISFEMSILKTGGTDD